VTTINDFFSMPEGEVKREGESPMLVPRGIDPASGIRSKYTRASYMSGYIEESEHFHKWEMRYLAKAMGQNEDLAALAAAETYSTGISDAVYGRAKSASGRRLDEIIERALDRVRIHEKADRGTAIHGFTEPGAPGPEDCPERLRPAVQSFWDCLRGLAAEIVGTEVFTANDDIMGAGTFDHLMRFAGDPVLTDYVVCDKKTGRYSPFEWAVQIATYAYGDVYDLTTDQRPAWPGTVNRKWGVVFLIDAEKGTTEPHLIDLEFGWEMAQIAARVRDAHERRDICTPHKPAPMHIRIGRANTKGDLERLWYSTDKPGTRAMIEEKARTL
jgi:hypothetical protein